MQKYIFLLGREPLLSIAELQSLFSSVERRGDFAFVKAENTDIRAHQDGLGWTIKIGLVVAEWIKKTELATCIVHEIEKKTQQGKKLRVGIDMFVSSMSSFVFKVKDILKDRGHSIRVVQHDAWRVKTATTIHEKLIEQWFECMVIPDINGFTVAETIWIQDIESYTERDIDRDRSMTVGMMPPKLAQIMINLATKWDKNTTIWDPFCGLWTTLIESLHAWYTQLLGTDIENKMVQMTKNNLEKQPLYMSAQVRVLPLDARKINTHILSSSTTIVTEGMLGTNFTSTSITHSWILQERAKLTGLYENFLLSACDNKDIKRIAFCLPFWRIGSEIIFMPEINKLCKNWRIDPICHNWKRYLSHERPWQCVGREIVVLMR
jgi:tRNA G10  N-methylase Trm11